MSNNCIAIIPARGGSKRIPKKNIKDFFGKPLLAYSIEVALESKLFDRVIVSTDDEAIAEIAKKYGAEIPFIRPSELSDDFTGTGAVVNHTIEYLKDQGQDIDFVCTIYATAPLLHIEYLKEGFERLKNSTAKLCFSATSMPFPIQRTFKLRDDGRCEMFTPEHFSTRSQDLDEAYQDAGQFYWENLQIESSEIAFGKDSIPIILPRHLVQDIDTLEDWERAEFMYQTLNQDIYDKWNSLKKRLNIKSKIHFFHELEVVFISIGQNIGYETLGKGNLYLRPVIVFKKLNKDTFIGIPLTSKKKKGSFYFTFQYKKDKDSTAMLNQIKSFDAKRIQYKSGKISQITYKILKEKVNELITPPKNEGSSTSANKQWPKVSIKESMQIITQEDNNVK